MMYMQDYDEVLNGPALRRCNSPATAYSNYWWGRNWMTWPELVIPYNKSVQLYSIPALQAKGYGRKGTENVVGPMPPMGQIVQTDDEVWRILAFVRSNYHGAPECKFGCGSD